MNKTNSLTNITKESITMATLILMDKKNYHDIKITEICEKAGVSRNAFYRNYLAKDEIIRLYLFDITEQYRLKIRTLCPITNIQYYTFLFTHLYKYKDLATKILKANIEYLLVDVFFRSFRDVANTSEYGAFYNCHIVGSIYSIFLHWIGNNRKETPQEIANMIIELNHLDPNEIVKLSKMTPKEELMYKSQYGDLIYKE